MRSKVKRAEGGKERGGLRRVVSTYNSLGMNIPATNNNNNKKKKMEEEQRLKN